MATNIAQISNPSIYIEPSDKLRKFISAVRVSQDMPHSISNIVFKNKVKNKAVGNSPNIGYLITEEDRLFLKSIKLDAKSDFFTKLPLKTTAISDCDRFLTISDLHWLYEYLQGKNKDEINKIYLHELLEGSKIILPKNQEVPRNMELEKRCQKLKAEQENKDYYQMTKNVDRVRKKLPEDTFSYQVRQMDKHLVAIFQFIVSVAAGFAFGFLGVELIIGSLDFGFRLLLGIICALIIALAELYFLAKRLNEDLQFESTMEKQQKNVKVD